MVTGERAVFSAGGRLAADANWNGNRRLLDVFGQREIHRLSNLPDTVAAMTFSADGRSFVWAERSGVIHWLELAGGGERRTLSGHAGAVSQLVFDAKGKRLLSASHDATTLVWDLIGKGPAKLSAEQGETCWADLADSDAAKAYQAMCRLIAAPADALALLSRHLKPVEDVDAKRIQRLIADLDADEFAVRDKATMELRRIAEVVEPALRKALASRPSLEMRLRLENLLYDVALARQQWHPSAEVLRQLRAVEVLEHLAAPEGQRLLEMLAKKATGTRLKCEARAALQRLQSARTAKKRVPTRSVETRERLSTCRVTFSLSPLPPAIFQ